MNFGRFLSRCIIFCAFPVFIPAVASDSSIEIGRKIGDYIGSTKVAQHVLYGFIDYCANEFPDKREEILRARYEWDKRNLSIVNSWLDVAQNILAENEVASSDIPSSISQIEAFTNMRLENLKPEQEQLAKQMDAKPVEERMRSCGFFIGLVISGARDIRVTSPQAMKIYEKFVLKAPSAFIKEPHQEKAQ